MTGVYNPIPAVCNMDVETVLLTLEVCGETRNVVVYSAYLLYFSLDPQPLKKCMKTYVC
jgi:hypothetical protein